MPTWVLTVIVVGVLNGQPIAYQQVEDQLRSPEHCLEVVREIQRTLPRRHRILNPICERGRVWAT
jgi:hypothetical protein